MFVYKLDREGSEWSEEKYRTEDEAFDAALECIEVHKHLGALLDEDELFSDMGGVKPYEKVFIGEECAFVPHIEAGTILDLIWEQAIAECGNLGSYWKARVLEKDSKSRDLDDSFTYILNRWLQEKDLMPDCIKIECIETRYLSECVSKCCENCLHRGNNTAGLYICMNELAAMYLEEIEEEDECELWEDADI